MSSTSGEPTNTPPQVRLNPNEENTLSSLKATMAEIQRKESALYGATLEGGAAAFAGKSFFEYVRALAKEHGASFKDVLNHSQKGISREPDDMAEQLAQQANDQSSKSPKGVALLLTKSASDMTQAAALSAHEFSNKPIPSLSEMRREFIAIHEFPEAKSSSDTNPQAQATPLFVYEKQYLSLLNHCAFELIMHSAMRHPFGEPALRANSAGDKALGALVRYVIAMAHEHHTEPADILKEMGLDSSSREAESLLAEMLKKDAARREKMESWTSGKVEKGGVAALVKGAATKMKQASTTEE